VKGTIKAFCTATRQMVQGVVAITINKNIDYMVERNTIIYLQIPHIFGHCGATFVHV